jgi:myo-inositol-1(or 4)-monophosphatase
VAQTAYYAGFFESPRGRARIERRSQLSVAAPELSATALNDVVVRAPPPADPVNRKTVGLDVFVGTEHVGTYHSDGVVVSTATGSTGLSLSVGGPVHDPQRSETVQTVPLATHSLGVRPLVVGSETPVTVVPNRPAVAIVDGGQRHHELAAETPIRVDGTAPPAELVATSVDDSFYDTLGDQLGWHVRENGPATESAAAPAEWVVGGATNDRPETGFDVEYETPVDLGRALRVAVDAVESVAGPLRRRHGDVERERHKTDNADIVTEADRFAEETITAILEAEFPACGCLSEERGATDRDGVAIWVVDPLDGTSNYANGNPNYCVSVGLLVDGEPTVGVVHGPETGELWTGVRGAFAWLDGRPVTTTTQSTLDESVLMSGYDPDGAFLREFYDDTRGVRRLGGPPPLLPRERCRGRDVGVRYLAVGRCRGIGDRACGRRDRDRPGRQPLRVR